MTLFFLVNVSDFSNNSLTGGVPDFLGNMKLLSFMYVNSLNMSSNAYQIQTRSWSFLTET